VEGPALGGDTLFSDSHAALLGLPAHLRDRVPGLHGVNDYGIFVGGGHGEDVYDAEIVEQVKAAIPFGVTHPIVRTHPETGKQALYLHGGFLRHDSLHDPATGEYLKPEESRRLVRELLEQHTRPEYQCRFRWEIGSVAFWDNRAVQHYAASDYYPEQRVLRRVTVRGDRPVHRPDAD
ncbi:MAG: TauD/TfdA family dioxygenase, partial [Actinomycetota bacterium]